MSEEEVDECPEILQQEFNDPVRYVSLMLFVFYTIYFPVTVCWWWTRRHHQQLRKRNFLMMVISGLGVYAELGVAMLGNFTGRRSFPCDAHLWLSYMIVPVAAGPVVARLCMVWARSRYSQLILQEGKRREVGDLNMEHFERQSTLKMMKQVARFIFCECGHYSVGDNRSLTTSMHSSADPSLMQLDSFDESGKGNKTFQKISKKVKDMSPKQREAEETRVMNLATIHLMTKFEFGVVVLLGFVVIGALFPIFVNYVKGNSPYGINCVGCHLNYVDIALMGLSILAITAITVVVLSQLKNQPDPLGMITELQKILVCGTFVVLGTVLAVIDFGDVRIDGKFDWILICGVASILLHHFHCPDQVIRTYRKQTNESLLNDINDVMSAYSNNRPTSEDGESTLPTLDSVLATKGGRRIFKKYLGTEYSVENLYFWDQVQRWKRTFEQRSAEERLKTANDIYKTFVKDNSMLEVNISSHVRRDILKEIGNPMVTAVRRDVFDDASKEIYSIMASDSFPRFVRSKYFQEWAMPQLAV